MRTVVARVRPTHRRFHHSRPKCRAGHSTCRHRFCSVRAQSGDRVGSRPLADDPEYRLPVRNRRHTANGIQVNGIRQISLGVVLSFAGCLSRSFVRKYVEPELKVEDFPMVRKAAPKIDPVINTMSTLLGKYLQGTATPDDVEQLNKASKEYVASETGEARRESERFMMAEQIMEMLVAEGSLFSVSESAELRHIFFRSDNPFRLLGALRKIRALA